MGLLTIGALIYLCLPTVIWWKTGVQFFFSFFCSFGLNIFLEKFIQTNILKPRCLGSQYNLEPRILSTKYIWNSKFSFGWKLIGTKFVYNKLFPDQHFLISKFFWTQYNAKPIFSWQLQFQLSWDNIITKCLPSSHPTRPNPTLAY